MACLDTLEQLSPEFCADGRGLETLQILRVMYIRGVGQYMTKVYLLEFTEKDSNARGLEGSFYQYRVRMSGSEVLTYITQGLADFQHEQCLAWCLANY